MRATQFMPVAAPPSNVSPHAAVIASLAAADPEPVLEAGLAQLMRGGDVPLLLSLAAAMVRCELPNIAEALLRSTGPAVERLDSVQQMLTHIGRLPSREIEAKVLSRRYEASCCAIGKHNADFRNRLDVVGPPPGLRFMESRAGNIHVLRSDFAPKFTTVFPFVHHRAIAGRANLPSPTLLTSYCMIGVPSVPMLERLWQQETGGYFPPIDIIESDFETFRIWLCLLKTSEMLESARVRVFVGANASADYSDFLVNTPTRLPPSVVLTNHRAGWAPPRLDADWRRNVEQRIGAKRRSVKDAIEASIRHRDSQFWKQRFAAAVRGEASLDIVGFTNRYSTVVQHAMRDLAAAFRRLGHRFEVVSQPDAFSPGVDVSGAIASHDRDLIVAINHLRFEYADVMPAGIPYVGWIQDHVDHLWKSEAGASVGDRDVVIAHAPDVLSGLYGYPRERLLASSNLTDPVTYSDEPLSSAELDQFRCDLSFASHGASTPEQLCDEIERVTTPAFGRMMRAFLAMARDIIAGGGCLNAQQLVAFMLKAERSGGHPPLTPAARRAHVYPQIARIHDRLFRHTTLEWAANWARSRGRSLRIHGRGWDRHPTLAAFAAGEVQSGAQLRALYQASSISLQANAYSSLHQRLLDGLACGSLVLSRFNPADFVRQPFEEIQTIIRDRSIRSLGELLAARMRDQRVAQACGRAEELSGAVIASVSDPLRMEHVRVSREANDIADLQTDEGLFHMLRDARYIPARVAADLPGFERATFRTESQFRTLLDELVDNAAARQNIVRPMREAVLVHDTFDGLAKRIIQFFAAGAS